VERDAVLEAKMAWLRQMMDWRRELVDAQEFVDSLKTDLFPEEVYVFTPKGDVVELPRGSTPVDFAYHVHTEIGQLCQGAKVNGKIVPLNYQLKDGDQVMILTAKRGGPSRDWLNPHLGYVRTSRARQKIRQFFRRQERAENITRGRTLLERELKRLGIEHESYEEIAKLFRFKKIDDLLAAIVYGDINVHQISTKLLDVETEGDETLPKEGRPSDLPSEARGVTVTGVGGLLTRIGGCCNPLPGDEIIGYVTRGQGVTIHRSDCGNVLRALRDGDKERLIEVDWGEDVDAAYQDHGLRPQGAAQGRGCDHRCRGREHDLREHKHQKEGPNRHHCGNPRDIGHGATQPRAGQDRNPHQCLGGGATDRLREQCGS
jgi:GTP pyrophosphokinase